MNTSKIASTTMIAAASLLLASAVRADAYSDAVLADSPIIYYTFAEDPNPIFASLNYGTGVESNDLRLYNTNGAFTTGPNGAAFPGFVANNRAVTYAAGSSVRIERGAFAASINGTSALTIEFWFKADTLPTIASLNSDGAILFNAQTSAGNGGLGIQVSNQGISVCGRSSTSDSYLRANFSMDEINKNATNLAVGTWTYLAATYDYQNKSVSLYINGSIIGTSTVNFSSDTYSVGTPQNNPVLGVSSTFNGAMDSFAIYKQTLTAEQVQQHYAAAIPETATSAALIGIAGVLFLLSVRICRKM